MIDLAREGLWERSFYRLRAASCFFDERVEAAKPPPLAEVANRSHVGIGVAGQKFHDVGTRFRASCVKLERDEVRKRHDSQAAARTDNGVGCRESAVDHRREPATVVHDLHEPEWAADIHDASERILAVGLPNLDLEARRPQRFCDSAQCAEIGVDAEVEIFRKPHVAVRCQSDGADDHRPYASRFENLCNFFGGTNHLVGVGHRSLCAGRRPQLRESRCHPQGRLDPFLDRHPPHTGNLGRPRGSMADAGAESRK